MFEAKAKASSLRGQGQGLGQFSSRPRPVFVMHCIISTVVVAFEINYLILVLFETKSKAKTSIFEAKAKASDHDCWKK